MNIFLAPESWPFSVAALVLLAIAVIEGLGLLTGLSLSAWLDHLLPEAGGLPGVSEAWLGWLHVGKVPLLILLALFLTAFSVIGFTANTLVKSLLGFYPPALLAAPLAFLGTLPVVRLSGAAIARLVPGDETSAVTLESLVGHVASVINGTARVGFPAEARVKNEHGLTLYVHVEPDNNATTFSAGDSVLLVRQISGSRFLAIANPRPDLL
ncbi:OB-fold-containig protein [Quatrionicoccus australiensis]|uniref:OB-fold-containig protein n=1 Tax=Quatrionicoccus australiensis TaxID=138118 RepID=UPI001CF98A60|nr:OB-fold-containig protein [Quatrionicoccus australiensis]MCB4358198.1 DUF1449 family protein [Quatrionicoccus australiensis]